MKVRMQARCELCGAFEGQRHQDVCQRFPQVVVRRVTDHYSMPDGTEVAKFMGLKVIIDEQFAKIIVVPRPWRERLFTRPWHPFVKTKAVRRGEPEFFVDNYHDRLYTCRAGLAKLTQAVAAHNELIKSWDVT